MDYGLRVYTDTNAIQIDSKFKNLALLRKFDVIPNTQDPDSFKNNRPMFYGVMPRRNPGEVFVLHRGAPFAKARLALWSTIEWKDAPISVYVFGPPPPLTGNGYGLEVFTESGELAFSSRYKYMRVVETILIGQLPSKGVNNNWPTRRYGIMMSDSYRGIETGASGPGADPGGRYYDKMYQGVYITPNGFGWEPIFGGVSSFDPTFVEGGGTSLLINLDGL